MGLGAPRKAKLNCGDRPNLRVATAYLKPLGEKMIGSMSKKDDLYIQILSYGKMNLGKPIKYSDLLDHLNENNCNYEEFAVRQFFQALFINENSPRGNDTSKLPPENGKFYLESHGYFNHLEHEELKSARKSSLVATVIAIFAILISLVSTGFSIYFSQKQLETPVKITEEQIRQLELPELSTIIKTLNRNQNSTLGELKSIQSIIKKTNPPNKKMKADEK